LTGKAFYLNIRDMPTVGISMRLELETRRFYLGRDYSEALFALGATPLHICLIPERRYIAECLDRLHGILIPGSDTDVDPHRFGEEPHPRLRRVLPEKEEFDFLILEEAYKRKMPVLGICYGMQIINVWHGGTLFQDIESQIPEAIKHEQGISADWLSHSISISNDGILSEIASAGNLEGNKIRVNSHHHQAVRDIGRGLKGIAWSKDGVIEAIEGEDKDHFILGVQWHPELSWRTDTFSREIFCRFINECLAYEKASKTRLRASFE